jgi:alginate production protein
MIFNKQPKNWRENGVFKRRRYPISLVLIVFVSLFLWGADRAIADPESSYKWVEFFSDDEPHVTTNLNNSLSFGAELEAKAESSRYLDLQSSNAENETEFNAQFNLLYDTGNMVRSYVELSFATEGLGGNKPDARDAILEVGEAYVTFSNKERNQALTLGRWSASDQREWLLDEALDGIHYFNRGEKFAIEVMYGREQVFRKDLLGDHESDKPDHLYLRSYFNLPGENTASIYGLYQKGRDAEAAELYWLGLSLAGEISNDMEYWAELAHVVGEQNLRNVRGFGFDVGITRTFNQVRYNPRLTAGFAFGSGDDGNGTDTAFRQTGIHGNSGKFGGETSFNYYGEVFDPELSNLAVLTFGAGFDFLKESSIDIIYHNTFQHRNSTSIRDSNLEQIPTGNSGHLGQEIDLVIGFREFDTIEVDFVGGIFFPGSAFNGTRKEAAFFGLEVSMEF